MVGHQAVAPDIHSVGGAPFNEEVKVRPVVIITEERLLPPVATLGDVVREPRCNSPRYPCHNNGHDERASSATSTPRLLCLIGDTLLIFTNSKLEPGPLTHRRRRYARF